MKNEIETLIDESYNAIKRFTKNNKLSDSEIKDLDTFIKGIQKTMNDIEEKKDINLIVNLGKTFDYLINNGIEDGKRNT